MGDDRAVRSFIALALEPELVDGVMERQRRVRETLGDPDVRWVRRENLHLTVRFLGELSHDELARADTVVCEFDGDFDPVEVELGGVAAFPSPSRPNVLWSELRSRSGALDELVGRVAAELAAAGFEPPDKPWTSHVTLGRVRRGAHVRPPRGWAARLTFPGVVSTIDCIQLIRSDLDSEGPTYTTLRAASGRKRTKRRNPNERDEATKTRQAGEAK